MRWSAFSMVLTVLAANASVCEGAISITAASTVTTGKTGLVASVPAQAGSTYAWTLSYGTITAGTSTHAITYTAGVVGTATLTCTVKNAANVSTVATKDVNVVAAPVATITADALEPTGRPGLVASVPEQAGCTYAWTLTNATKTGGNGTQSITYTAGAVGSATLKCTVKNAAGMAVTGTWTVLVVADKAAVVSKSPVTTLATGLTASVPVTAGATYAWSATGNATITSATNANSVTYTAGAVGTAKLSCMVTATTATSGTKTIGIVAAPIATITTNTSVTTGTAGHGAFVQAQPGCTYAWTISGGTITAGGGTRAITYTAGTVGNLKLGCTVKNAAKDSATDNRSITVVAKPAATITTAASVLSGTLGVPASVPAQSGCTFTWTVTNGTITSGQGSNAIAYTPGTTGTATLKCVVKNTAGTTTTGTKTATVTAFPRITITAQPKSQSVLVNQPVTFSVTATCTAPLHYQWRKDGTDVGTDSATLSIPSTGMGDAGSYVVIVWGNPTHSVTSKAAILTVDDVPPGACNSAALGIGATLNGYRPFPDDNAWNQDISNASVDPNSSAIISFIGGSTGLHPDFGAGLWEGRPIGIPYAVVGSDQAKVPVNYVAYGDESDPGPMPIPVPPPYEGPDPTASTGDRHVLVMDRDACVLYELYGAQRQTNGSWKAGSGAIWNLKTNDLRPFGWTSADAAGLPIFPGLARYDEVAAGEITHALRFTVDTSRKAYVLPATHCASSNTSANAPPMGMRVRLKASVDISGYTPQAQVVLHALKKYGMILADNGSSWYISGTPDDRWDNDDLHNLSGIKGSDFEVVQMGTIYTADPSGPAPAISSFAADPAAIVPGGSAELHWSTTNANRWFISPDVGWVNDSHVTVSPTNTTTYTLLAEGPYGQVTQTATVTVNSAATVHILFLHHSTGGCVWGGGVPQWFTNYNTQHSTNYQITERAYPDTPYPWANYPYDYWNLWVNPSGPANTTQPGVHTLETLVANNDVIVFKHCFPVSGIDPDTGNASVSSEEKTEENYKLQYAALKERLHQFPNKKFVVWTGAALIQSATTQEQGQRARDFFTWVKNTWDEPGDNIFVWDFFELETEGGLYLKQAYSSGDSHPNAAFCQTVAPYFGQRLVNVIEGHGDTARLDGRSTGSEFPIGVWLQSPIRQRNGVNNAVNYQGIGINTFLGLWQWPDESWAYPGYSVAVAQALKSAGLKAYAGSGQAAVTWIQNHPEFTSTFQGYLLGDEPDMNKVSGDPNLAAASMPNAWETAGDALRSADPARVRYANFGKGFALDPWVGYHLIPGPAQADDFAKYTEPTTVVSSDYYAITDPYEALEQHGVWGYGRVVDNTRKNAGGRPVWGFVEASAPFSQGKTANNLAAHMPPSLINPIVWEMIVHGADGIAYFCHDFSNGGMVEDGCLTEIDMPQAMKAANASVQRYAGVLLAPEASGTSATSSGSVAVATRTKKVGGWLYVFAMADGNSSYPDGQSVDATITLSGYGNGTVQVLDENRTLPMTAGKFSDHFDAYGLHIYRVALSGSPN
jgi:hypothetical protein